MQTLHSPFPNRAPAQHSPSPTNKKVTSAPTRPTPATPSFSPKAAILSPTAARPPSPFTRAPRSPPPLLPFDPGAPKTRVPIRPSSTSPSISLAAQPSFYETSSALFSQISRSPTTSDASSHHAARYYLASDCLPTRPFPANSMSSSTSSLDALDHHTERAHSFAPFASFKHLPTLSMRSSRPPASDAGPGARSSIDNTAFSLRDDLVRVAPPTLSERMRFRSGGDVFRRSDREREVDERVEKRGGVRAWVKRALGR